MLWLELSTWAKIGLQRLNNAFETVQKIMIIYRYYMVYTPFWPMQSNRRKAISKDIVLFDYSIRRCF